MIPNDNARGQQLEGLMLKSATLSASSATFNNGLKKKSAMMPGVGMMTSMVNSVTNFFKGSSSPPPPAMMAQKSMAPKKEERYLEKNPPAPRSMMSASRGKSSLMAKMSSPRQQQKMFDMSEMIEENTIQRNYMMCEDNEEDEDMEMECAKEMRLPAETKERKKRKASGEREGAKKQSSVNQVETEEKSKGKVVSIDEVIKQQNVDGSFNSENLLKQLFPDVFMSILSEGEAQKILTVIVISYAVAKWIEKNHPEKQYALIVKKALSYVKKSHKLEDLQFLDILLN